MSSMALTNKGFTQVCAKTYVKENNDLFIILEETLQGLKLILPCASALVDNENQINGFISLAAEGKEHVKISYKDRRIEATCQSSECDTAENTIDDVSSIMEKTVAKYDLLPVCMCCGRIAAVNVQEHSGRIETMCILCKENIAFSEKKEEAIRKSLEPYKKEKAFGVVPTKAVTAAVMCGVFGGLIACQAGIVMLMLDIIFSMFYEFVWILPALAGFFTMRRLRGLTQLDLRTRILIGSISAIVTMAVVSVLVWIIYSIIMECITGFKPALPQTIVFPSIAHANIFVGLPGFFLAEVATFFWFT